MIIIAGLGNPDEKYERTRHNVGFMTVEAAAQLLNVRFKKTEGRAKVAEGFAKGEKFLLCKPQTYMNLSGESAKQLVSKNRIPTENFLVVYDDVDLPKGTVRIRAAGGSGTHNGMRNIVAELGTERFPRIRVGIGKPEDEHIDLADYVLGNIPREEQDLMFEAIKRAAEAVCDFARGMDIEKLMQKYNGK